MALTELLSTLSIGTYEQQFPNAFTKPSGPGSTNGEPEDGTLFDDDTGDGIPDRKISGYTPTGIQLIPLGTKHASYNKFNLRTDSWNGNSLGITGDQPFILRGLQKANSTEPEYWGGFADTITDTPRGGISAFVDRDVADKIRLTKFLASPKGIMYTAKQVGLQLTNPNVESFFGVPNPLPVPLTNKFYNPISPVFQNPLLGVRGRRDTLLPIDIGYRYEDIHKARAIGVQVAGAVGLNVPGTLDPSTTFNRLNLLRIESFPAVATGIGGVIGDIATTVQGISSNISNSTFGLVSGLPFLTLTSTSGPKSMFGAGITPIRRYVNTGENASSGPLAEAGKRWATNAPLPVRVPGSTTINDFRISPTPLTSPATQNFIQISPEEFNTQNIYRKYGIVDSGRPGLVRQDPTRPAGLGLQPIQTPNTTGATNEFTPSTTHDSYGATVGGIKDLVEFSLTVGTTKFRFRSYINSISDSWSVDSEEGTRFSLSQVVKSKKYTGVNRSISVDFIIPVLSKADHSLIMDKLNVLAKLPYGLPGANDPNTRRFVNIKNLVIGKLISSKVVLTSLSYDIDNETPWDIDEETPMVIQVSAAFQEIADLSNPISAI